MSEKCPEDYTQCKHYHSGQNIESRCIKGSELKCCTEELRVRIKVNKEFSNKLKKTRGLVQG